MMKIENDNFKLEKQDEIKRKLILVTQYLKSISNIGLNYMEYISALIYVMYENRKQSEYLIEGNFNNITKYIDESLNIIRKKEGSMKLFENIRFSDIINIDNYEIFYRVIFWLNKIISDVDNLEEEGKKILANAFEYIIMRAASENELNNNEFYTPKGVVKLMVKLLEMKPNTAIYNPACGTGNFIVESAKETDIYAFGEDDDITNYNICFTNLWLHDIKNRRIKESNNEILQKVDVALANPPFVEKVKIRNRENNPYVLANSRNYAKYLIMMLDSVNERGKIAIILPHGFLFKSTIMDNNLRRYLIEKNYIDAIIGLPEKLFYKTKIPVVILLINKNKHNEGTLFIDASREYTSKRKTNILAIENQNKIYETYKQYKFIPNYSYVASFEEIKKNNFDLNIKRYVQIQYEVQNIDQFEEIDKIKELEKKRYRIQHEINDLIENIKIL